MFRNNLISVEIKKKIYDISCVYIIINTFEDKVLGLGILFMQLHQR